jgi:hypothetical protein
VLFAHWPFLLSTTVTKYGVFMNISVSLGEVRFRPYNQGGDLKGFVDFQLVLRDGDKEGLLELKDWTIRQVTFEGKTSMRLMPPGKPADAGSQRKYNNYAFVQGPAWWTIADEVIKISLNGGGASAGRSPASTTREEAPAPAAPARPTRGGGFMGRGAPGRGLV